MSLKKAKFLKIVLLAFLFLILTKINSESHFVLAIDSNNPDSPETENFNQESNLFKLIKELLEKTKIYLVFPKLYLNLTASISEVEAPSQIYLPQPMKDLSTFNLASDRYYIRPWETNGLVECEPWGVGKGISVCLAPVFPGDLPCPIFMDCDGDGHYWFKGEDCDENCPTCYVGSKFYTDYPDGRDQDCDGLVDDNIECQPTYGANKTFGYDADCNFTPNTSYILINEGEVGEIPYDEVHCQKRWGQCTDYQGGFSNCTVSKTPGYFVKSSGINCGGGVWRQNSSNALFDCGKALRPTSYRGYIGCGKEQCCRYTYVCHETNSGIVCECTSPCECNNDPCPNCNPDCYYLPHPYDACFPGNCPINASFQYGSGVSGGSNNGGGNPPPPSPPSGGIRMEAPVKNYFLSYLSPQKAFGAQSQVGPWALCHGYSQISCQQMTGCERKFVENKYY
ncbi:MAG TPA: hypothetical protein PK418_01210 [Candidatus Paceibacterota bacterium]|nr:hypothetical protein [Candidatus Paceibacterota bacterium]